jgi:hypothetical protein
LDEQERADEGTCINTWRTSHARIGPKKEEALNANSGNIIPRHQTSSGRTLGGHQLTF